MIDVILDFVFNNLFIVIIIIAVISNLVGGSKKTKRPQEKRQQQDSPSRDSQETLEEKIEKNLKKFENIFEPEAVEEKVPEAKQTNQTQTSIELQREKQRDALANRFQTRPAPTSDEKTYSNTDLPTVIKHHSKQSSVNQKNLKKRISKKGLQESIVMAEVLGKPRALKPYRSDRRN